MSLDCCVALLRGATGLSAGFDCGISLSYSLTMFAYKVYFEHKFFLVFGLSKNGVRLA